MSSSAFLISFKCFYCFLEKLERELKPNQVLENSQYNELDFRVGEDKEV
jgi:hypothetical protein